MPLTLALVQMEIDAMDPHKNLGHIETLAKRAKKKGAELIIFPEDAVCGPLQGQTAFVAHAQEYLTRMQVLAAKLQVDLVPGSWTVAVDGLHYNVTHYIAADGTVLGAYRKINLWETEKAAVSPGTVPAVFATRFGITGLIICWDLAFPELFTAMNAQGVQLVIAPAYWSFPPKPAGQTKDDDILLIDSLCTARAFENNIVLAYCNAAGTLEDQGVKAILSGRSQITHPAHKVVAQCEGNNEEILVASVELPVQLSHKA